MKATPKERELWSRLESCASAAKGAVQAEIAGLEDLMGFPEMPQPVRDRTAALLRAAWTRLAMADGTYKTIARDRDADERRSQ